MGFASIFFMNMNLLMDRSAGAPSPPPEQPKAMATETAKTPENNLFMQRLP
jgi:hypothetical protein